MTGILALALAVAPGADPFPYAEAEAELSAEIRADELKAHVYRLASPGFNGPQGPGAAPRPPPLAPAARRQETEGVPDGGHARPVDGQRDGRVRLRPGQRELGPAAAAAGGGRAGRRTQGRPARRRPGRHPQRLRALPRPPGAVF